MIIDKAKFEWFIVYLCFLKAIDVAILEKLLH